MLRRLLLELAALLPTAAVVGFLGPFGTYVTEQFLQRLATWLAMLLGAWLVQRPAIALLDRLAAATRLPRQPVRWFGVVVLSGPLALLWQLMGMSQARVIGIAGVLLFAMLSSALIVTIAWWAERAEARLRAIHDEPPPAGGGTLSVRSPAPTAPLAAPAPPRLHQRLSRSFMGEVIALESEDHYVRVHGARGSELLLIRLRDAIAEMDNRAGAQTHRSWWIAADAIGGFDNGSRQLTLSNGLVVPVARETVARLQRSGVLPG